MYHSEHGQDKWLNENVFHDAHGLSFFECGAIDGLITSNSLFFEQELGWDGICVEANPEEYAKLVNNRKCGTEHCALMDRCGEVQFKAFKGGLVGWSAAIETLEPQHSDRIAANISQDLQQIITVPALTLEAVLDKHGLKSVDYLTLDIEGAEFNVLRAFPFNKFSIDIFDIEDNFGNFPIEALMNSNGYDKLIRLGVSDIYRKRK
jgi:FkbM family methyltransferase